MIQVPEDLKSWYALSCPTTGVRFNAETLKTLDANGDGRIRSDEVKAALAKVEEGSPEEAELKEFVANYVTMERLYKGPEPAMFQLGVLRIDAKELNLCFHVADEEAHAALVPFSKCCVIYVKLSRHEEEPREICAVVTAGTIAGLYVGRNGVFSDRDGKDWEATISKVVEAQVSLVEAFWHPWRKLGETIANTAKKFIGEKEAKATALVSTEPTKETAKEGGAALASSVAAIGIGIGMIGAAAASLMAALSQMTAVQIAIAVVALVLVISLPSVILTWFNLRKRDLGAILNASGWAINRPMTFSMRLARTFTKCA